MKRLIPGLVMLALLAGACGPKPEPTTPDTTSATATTTQTTVETPPAPPSGETGTPAGVVSPGTEMSPAASPGTQSPITEVSPGTAPAVGMANPAAGPPPAGDQKTLPTGVKYTIIKAGNGPIAEKGKTVKVQYTGWLTNGKKFDSSHDRNDEPFEFLLGSGQVIRGWDAGVQGMKVGEKRRLEIPADQGYGAQGQGEIPANSTLIFEVDLQGVQ